MSLAPRILYGDLDLTAAPYLVRFGAMYGRPENVYEALVSMMQDGEPISSTRTSNRQLELPVMIEESDLRGLAEAERALILECEKPRNTLTVDPGDGWGSATVFDTFKAQPTHEREDTHEMAGVRMFSLSIPAMPFARSATSVTIPALPAAAVPSTVTLSDGTSTTGWTDEQAGSFGALSASGGWLQLPSASTVTADSSGQTLVERSKASLAVAATDFSVTPYVSVDIDTTSGGTVTNQTVTMYADGLALTLINMTGVTATRARWTFLCPDASVTKLTVEVFTRTTYPAAITPVGGPHLIDDLKRSNVPPKTSTARQLVRTLEVKGSVRTPVQLAIEHPTAALGDVIVYTGGPQPDLRRWRTGGGTTTADTSLVSGAYDLTGSGSGFPFAVPSAMLKRGGYALVARMRASGAGTNHAMRWTVGAQTGVAHLSLTTEWQIVTLAGVIAPDVDVLPSSTAVTAGSIVGEPTASAAHIDEAWLFYVGEGAALTIVSCGTGTPAAGSVHNRLWLKPADTERRESSIWRGTQADMSDAIHAGPVTSAWGDHRFVPPSVSIYTATTGVENALVSGSYFPSDAFHAVD